MDQIDEILYRGVDKIYPSRQSLEKVLRSDRKIRLYQGFDPTGIELHIGHLVGLMKLRQFQLLGHHVIFLIGDGTGLAGDPSGKNRTRQRFLTQEELRHNAKGYALQAAKIIDFQSKNKAEILARVKQNIKLAKKYKLKMKFIAQDKKNERNLYDLKALGLVLGMPTSMVKEL